MPATPAVIEAIGRLLPPLLDTLDRVAWVQRHLFPPPGGRLADALAPRRAAGAGPLSGTIINGVGPEGGRRWAWPWTGHNEEVFFARRATEHEGRPHAIPRCVKQSR